MKMPDPPEEGKVSARGDAFEELPRDVPANDDRPGMTPEQRGELVRQYWRWAAWTCPGGVPPGFEPDAARGDA